MGTTTNIKLEPMSVTWGTNTVQVETVTCRADVSSDLNNDYFFIYDTSAVKYHVWYNVGAAGSDPAPGGSTAVVVALTANDTAGTVATATAAAIDALGSFGAAAASAVVTITHAASGYATNGHEGVGTSFSFAVTTEGDTAADIGFTDGDLSVSVSEDLVDVMAHQHGSNVLSQIRTGKQVEATITVKETTVAQLSKLLRQGGGAFTPAGGGGTAVNGWGTSKDFSHTITNAKKLVLHPVVLGAADLSRDVTLFKAYAQLSDLTFSGENIFTVPVTFKCYPDLTLNDRVEYFAYGDGSQTLT